MLKLGILLAIGVCLLSVSAKDLQLDLTTASTTVSMARQHPTATADSLAASEGISKRDLKATDASAANTNGIAGKNYDPPPEYYRGPGSTGHPASTTIPTYHSNFKPYNGFKDRPVTFPDAYSTNNKPNGDGGGHQASSSDLHSANSYNSWQHLSGKVGAVLNKNDNLQDRISVGHYTNSEHGSSASGGYAYEGRPYGGQAHHAEYYGSRVPPSTYAAGYQGASVATEGIPFDVYGNKNHYPVSVGNDYTSYTYSDVAEPAAHKSHADKVLLAKSFLIPLASAAVLGIAAALVSNPLLLQLGTVSGVAPAAAIYGKRKKRDLATAATPDGSNKANDFNLALSSPDNNNKKESKLLPYRGHHQQ